MRNVWTGIQILAVLALTLTLTACATGDRDRGRAYWDRPGARLTDLASESQTCYQNAILDDSPSALATAAGNPGLLPRTTPPPALWRRPPRQAALEHFDEQLRYEQCMRQLGWRPVRAVPPAL